MPEFKSPASRLARLFHKSRERWKQRAAEKQKKLRGLELKLRDLTESRDLWKQRARSAKQELSELKAQAQAEQKKGISSVTSL